MNKFKNAPINEIVPSRWQPREGVGSPEAFQELVANVKAHGVKSPLKAFANEQGAYELITGHRRWQAAIQASLTHVPLIVVDTPQDRAGMQALREEVLFDNLLHEPLTPLEEARAFRALQEEEGYSIRQMAEKLGKGAGYIQARFDLLRFPEDVQELVYARAYTLRHAREIAKVEDPEIRAALIEETKAGASCREIIAKVNQILSSPEEKPYPIPVEEPIEELCPHGLIPEHCAYCQGYEEEDEEPEEELAEERLIPINGNGQTTYVSMPAPPKESVITQESPVRQIIQKYIRPEKPSTVPASGQHCPHCGDGRGKERCHQCGKERWSINFATFENYQKALVKTSDLVGK